jgi:hypothetical protein
MPTPGVAPTPSDMPVGQQKKGAPSSAAMIPFARASKLHIEQSNVQTVVPSTSQQVINFPVASYGYLSALLVTVVATGGTGVAAVFYEDAPWSVLAQVQLSDVNGVPLFQLSGFNAYLAAKYGGYRLFPPDGIGSANSTFGTATTNANVSEQNRFVYSTTSDGNYKFILPLFLEFGLDGLGCLPNMDASARYNLQLTVNNVNSINATTGPVYTTTPTGLPTAITVTVEVLARSQPPAQDMFGNVNSTTPPAVGTVQYWTNQTASGLANGANTIQLSRVGNLVRNHIFVFRNTNGTRITAEGADVPSLFEFDWDVGQRYVANTATLRYIFGYAAYGIDVPNGVILLSNTMDPDWIGVSEYGDQWLGTVGATKFTMRFTTTAGNGSMSILTNDIVPASGQVYAAPMLMTG